MILLLVAAFVGSLVADEVLFRAIKLERPNLFKKLGEPDWTMMSWNLVVIFKVAMLILLPSSVEVGGYLHRKLWVCRLVNMLLVCAIILLVT
ncbi:hypothetical protein [Pleionea sediminis]|uniref:hypothetical protein n=1 Tax=Pleionea sediminis TaxID=2569479 RepID=UPI001185D2C9|nr:hypothetical protein [Pleionea sediminis]